MGQFAGRRLTTGHQLVQVRPFLRRQSHPILVHGSRPILKVVSPADHQGTGYCLHLSNEDGWPTSTSPPATAPTRQGIVTGAPTTKTTIPTNVPPATTAPMPAPVAAPPD